MSAPPLFTLRFVALLVTQSSFGYAFSTFMLLPKFLAAELGAGPVEIGQVTALYGGAAMIFTPLAGAWVDRFGRLRFLRGGILLMGATAAGFLSVDAMGPLVYALRFAQGIAWALAFVAAGAIVTDQAPPERMGQAIGLFGVSMLSMNALAPAAAEEIAARSGWAPVFALAAAAAVLAYALSFGLREVRTPPDDGEAVPGLGDVLRRARTLWFSSVVALCGVAFGAMITFSQPWALEKGIANVRAFFVAYAAAAIFVRVALGPFADRAGRHRVSLGSFLLYGAATLSMAALEPGRLGWIGLGFGLAHGFFYPAFNALALERAGEHERGKFMAIFNGAFNAGWALGGLALGELAARAGYPSVFVAAALVILVGFGLLLAAREIRRPGTV